MIKLKSFTARRSLYILPLLSFLTLPFFHMEAAWVDRKAEGWAWYEDKEPEKKQEVEVIEIPPPIMTASEQLEESKKNLQEKLAKALLEPSTENVKDYIQEQQIATERATEFSNSWAKVLLSHPNLDFTAKENAISSYGAQVQKQVLKQEKELLISNISRENGLFFIYKGEGAESRAFAVVVNILVRKYGFEVLGISVDGTLIDGFKNNNVDNGIVENLGVEIFPALLVVNPKTETVTPVSFGMRALDQVEENIFMQFNEVRGNNG